MKKNTYLSLLFLLSFSVLSFQLLGQITPTAGATETFSVTGGEDFFDPGGMGGDCNSVSGQPGAYPNCGCITTTTLCGPAGTTITVDFTEFEVFLTFDWLNIYDGTTTADPLMYDSTVDGDDLTLMMGSTGTSFTSTGECLTFEFRSSTVVNYCGWEATVTVNTAGPPPITLVPTMTEWGLFLFGLGMVTLGLVFVYNKQRQLA